MPLYDYQCTACSSVFEASHGMSEAGPGSCPNCGSTAIQKLISAPCIVMDWRDSDSVHASQRFRDAVRNPKAVGGST